MVLSNVPGMKTGFVDLYIHLGATLSGKPVKITASRSLTLENVLLMK